MTARSCDWSTDRYSNAKTLAHLVSLTGEVSFRIFYGDRCFMGCDVWYIVLGCLFVIQGRDIRGRIDYMDWAVLIWDSFQSKSDLFLSLSHYTCTRT